MKNNQKFFGQTYVFGGVLCVVFGVIRTASGVCFVGTYNHEGISRRLNIPTLPCLTDAPALQSRLDAHAKKYAFRIYPHPAEAEMVARVAGGAL